MHTPKWIVEVNLKEGGVRVSAFDVWFPKQKSKRTNANEHDDRLEKYGGAFSHSSYFGALFIVSVYFDCETRDYSVASIPL